MHLDRNELTVQALKVKLDDTRVGIIAKDITGIDLIKTSKSLEEITTRKLFIAIIGYENDEELEEQGYPTEIEEVVKWRNSSYAPGSILIFLKGAIQKAHSLNDFDVITMRDLAQQLICEAREEIAGNDPQKYFWEALGASLEVAGVVWTGFPDP